MSFTYHSMLLRIVHTQPCLLHSMCDNVRVSESEVPEGAHKVPIGASISNRSSNFGCQLGPRVAVCHLGVSLNFSSIFLLGAVMGRRK